MKIFPKFYTDICTIFQAKKKGKHTMLEACAQTIVESASDIPNPAIYACIAHVGLLL